MSRAFSTRSAAAVTVLVLAVSGVACSGGGEPQAGPTSPSPSPSRVEAGPVKGEREVQTFAVSNEQAVWDRAQPQADPAAIDQAAGRVADWLDGHLTALQDGGEGHLQEVAAPGLLDGADPGLVDAVTSALAGPQRPVGSATYQLLVAHTDAPQWVRATANVTGPDSGTRTAQFVFEVAEESIVLIAAGPGSGEARS